MRRLPAPLAGNGGKALDETRGRRRRAGNLCSARQDHFARAEHLGEVVSGKADPALRQIETETLPHRAAEPGIGSAFRRPCPLDEPAEHDAVAFGEPRFERAQDAHAHTGPRRPAHHPVGKSGGKELDIIGWRNEQAAAAALVASSSSASASLAPSGPSKGTFALAVPRQRRQHLAMTRGDVAERARLFAEAFERRQRVGEPANEIGGGRQVRCRSSRCADRKDADRPAPCAGIFRAARERHRARGKVRPCRAAAAARAGSRARARRRRSRVWREPSRSSGCLSKPSKRHRREAAERRVGRKPGKRSGRRVGQRIAAAIFRVDVPARQRGENAPRQRAVRRHQGGGLALVAPLRAAPPRWQATRLRHAPPRSW